MIRADSGEVDQTFELFPGYDNLTYTDDDGYAVVDASKNSGLPDRFVPGSRSNEFLEYEFTANNLDLFNSYGIKILYVSYKWKGEKETILKLLRKEKITI